MKTSPCFTPFFLLLIALLVSAPNTQAQNEPHRFGAAPSALMYGDAIRDGRNIVSQLMQDHSIPGLSVSVNVGGKTVWTEGFGWADLENLVPVSPLTRFRIASISKPVSATALALLMESEKLDPDATIQQYVPYFPQKRWPVTVRQVAGHTGGIRHYRGAEFISRIHYRSVKDAIGVFSADTLLFEPGTESTYSSYGFNLLSAVVEGASGEDFLTFMRRNVFEPLALNSIVPDHADSLVRYRASFYNVDDRGQATLAPWVDNSVKWAGGGFLSNADDLTRFGSVWIQDSFLNAETRREFFKRQTLRDGTVLGYGMGWAIGTDPAGRPWVGHSGGAAGARSMLLLYPEENVVVAILTNSSSAPINDTIAQRIADSFVPNGARLPTLLWSEISHSSLQTMLGLYQNESETIRIDGDKRGLTVIFEGNQHKRFYQTSESNFAALAENSTLTFSFDSQGNAKTASVNGKDWTRVKN